MNIQTANDPTSATKATNFSVVRLKRDVLQRSSIGMMATNRSVATAGIGSNSAYGVDGAFLLSQALTVGTYWAQTSTTGVRGDNQSYQGRVDYSVDRYGAKAEFLSVGKNFDPQIGFRRRSDFNRSYAELRFSPRPAHMPNVRKFTWTGSGEYVANGAGSVDARVLESRFGAEFASSDQLNVDLTHDYRIPSPAVHAVGITHGHRARWVQLF